MHAQAGRLCEIKFHTCDGTSKDESSTTQWINILQNNMFVFLMVVSFIVPKTGPIHLVLVGLIAGRQAGR